MTPADVISKGDSVASQNFYYCRSGSIMKKQPKDDIKSLSEVVVIRNTEYEALKNIADNYEALLKALRLIKGDL